MWTPVRRFVPGMSQRTGPRLPFGLTEMKQRRGGASAHYRVSRMRPSRSIAAPLAVFMLLAGCGTDSDTSPSDTSAQATATTDPQRDAPPEASPDSPKPPAGVEFDVLPGAGGDSVFAEFDVSENVVTGTVRTLAQDETVAILKYARGTYPDASKIFVLGWLPPAEGSIEERQVLDAEYRRATLEKMNFDQIDPAQIWELRDGGTVHPELQ